MGPSGYKIRGRRIVAGTKDLQTVWLRRNADDSISVVDHTATYFAETDSALNWARSYYGDFFWELRD